MLYLFISIPGNQSVTFYELNSIFGHDTFLLDLNGVGAAVKVWTYMFMLISVKLFFINLLITSALSLY